MNCWYLCGDDDDDDGGGGGGDRLLRPENRLLSTLGVKMPYELVVGLNGRIWIKATPARSAVLIMRAIHTLHNCNDNLRPRIEQMMLEMGDHHE